MLYNKKLARVVSLCQKKKPFALLRNRIRMPIELTMEDNVLQLSYRPLD